MFFHELDPIAFSLGPLDIYWYSLSYILGILISWLIIWIFNYHIATKIWFSLFVWGFALPFINYFWLGSLNLFEIDKEVVKSRDKKDWVFGLVVGSVILAIAIYIQFEIINMNIEDVLDISDL